MIHSLAVRVRDVYGSDLPALRILAVGKSGEEITRKLAHELSETTKGKMVVDVAKTGEKGKKIEKSTTRLANRRVLICDSIVNSGTTMENVRNWVLAQRPKDILTLSLVVRNDSRLIPNFYALYLAREDEVYFGTNVYPVLEYNPGHIRIISDSDSGKTLELAVGWIDNRLDDYLYAVQTDSRCRTFVIEDNVGGDVVGIMHTRRLDKRTVFVDSLAVDKQFRGKGYAASLLIFLENYCKANGFHRARLLAFLDVVSLYRKFGFMERETRLTYKPYGTFVEMEISYLP